MRYRWALCRLSGARWKIIKDSKHSAEIDRNKARIKKAMEMMLDGEIESSEYKGIKSRFDMANSTLLRQRASSEMDKVDYLPKAQRML